MPGRWVTPRDPESVGVWVADCEADIRWESVAFIGIPHQIVPLPVFNLSVPIRS